MPLEIFEFIASVIYITMGVNTFVLNVQLGYTMFGKGYEI